MNPTRTWARNLAATAAAYALLAFMSLALAKSPGYSTPIFPAMGLAVALALEGAPGILPGIWLGSLLTNAGVAWQGGGLSSSGMLVAAGIATGSTAQVWLARTLVRRFLRQGWPALTLERENVLFLALAGPIACLTAATWATAILAATGLIPPAQWATTWWTWWTGDTMGVLVGAPLALILLRRKEAPWNERLFAVGAPSLLTLALVTAAFMGAARWERIQIRTQVEETALRLTRSIELRLVAHEQALASLCRLVEVTPGMTFPQFEHFTRLTLRDNPDLFALSINPLVTRETRDAFERAMSGFSPTGPYRIRERDAGGRLVPAGDRPLHVAVQYIAPLEGNLPAIGFDIHSEPIRREAIRKALATGEPAATAPIRLVQEQRARTGILILHPILRRGSPPGVAGFAVAVAKMDELVQIATAQTQVPGISFRLDDADAPGPGGRLFQAGPDQAERPFLARTRLRMADRNWTLEAFPTPAYLAGHKPWLAWGVGLVGLSFTALLQVMLMAMTGRSAEIREQVRTRTQELVRAKEELERVNGTLVQKIDEGVAHLRMKDKVLISHGRLAAMGEMVGNIAHQWRQPLNALAMVLMNLKDIHQAGDLTAERLDRSLGKADLLIQKMSSTINDFRNFARPDKEPSAFSALDQVRSAVALVDSSFGAAHVAIRLDAPEDLRLHGFPNEFSQALLNLLTNARQAIQDAGAEAGEIRIALAREGDRGALRVTDTGGGIPEAVLDRIFEPYFSTRESGTGIGLYMSKEIIESSMKGALTARNVPGGAEFTILLPLAGA